MTSTCSALNLNHKHTAQSIIASMHNTTDYYTQTIKLRHNTLQPRECSSRCIDTQQHTRTCALHRLPLAPAAPPALKLPLDW